MNRKAALFLVLLILPLLSLGCPEKSQRLIGTWKIEEIVGQPSKGLLRLLKKLPEDSVTIAINQDRTLEVKALNRPLYTLDWEVQGNRIILTDEQKGRRYDILFKVSRDQLRLRFYKDSVLILSRQDQTPSAQSNTP